MKQLQTYRFFSDKNLTVEFPALYLIEIKQSPHFLGCSFGCRWRCLAVFYCSHCVRLTSSGKRHP